MDRLHQATVVVKRHHNGVWCISSRDHCDIGILYNLIDNCTKAISSLGKIYDPHGYSIIE